MFATSASLTGNPGIEWTYCNSTPATKTLTHTHRRVEKKEQQLCAWKTSLWQHFTIRRSPLALGSTGPGPNHRVLTYCIVWSSLLSLPHITHHPLWLSDWRNQRTDCSPLGHPPVAYQPRGQDLSQPWWVRHYWCSQCQVETSMAFSGCVICKFRETCMGISDWMSR